VPEAAKKPQRAIDRLADLDQAVVDAEARREAVEEERKAANRAVRQTRSQLRKAEERLGAGEPVETEITEIEAALAKAIDVADVRREPGGSVLRQSGPDAEPSMQNLPEREEVPDRGRWPARLAGAERVVEEAILARDQFARAAFPEIAAELSEEDAAATEALAAAWKVIEDAANAYALRLRLWYRLAEFGGIDPKEEIPIAPLEGDLMKEVSARFEALATPTPTVLR
jgi:hypothetical protein